MHYVLFVLMFIIMARKGGRGRGRFRPYLRGAIDLQMALGTLGGSTLISTPVGDTVTEKAWLSSVVCAYALRNWTDIVNVGPILVGVAHSDYTSAEIEAWIENTGSWEAHDMVQQEVAKRKIKRVGILNGSTSATISTRLDNGLPIRTKCGWMLGSGQMVQLWAFNTGSQAIATTDPVVEMQGHANLWPR